MSGDWRDTDEACWASTLAGGRDYTGEPWYSDRDRVIREMLGPIEAENVVELCAAPGRFAMSWLGLHPETRCYWALDWSPSGVELMRQRVGGPRFYAVVADCRAADAVAAIGTADLVVCTACEHVAADIPGGWVSAMREGARGVMCWSNFTEGSPQHIAIARAPGDVLARCGPDAGVDQIGFVPSQEGRGQWVAILTRAMRARAWGNGSSRYGGRDERA